MSLMRSILRLQPLVSCATSIIRQPVCHGRSANQLLSCRSHDLVKVTAVRYYAKKGKKPQKGGKGGGRVEINTSVGSEVTDIEAVRGKMQKALDALKEEYVKNLSLRTSVGSLDSISVQTVNGRFPLNHLGQIVMKSPQMYHVNMVGAPQEIPSVLQAISQSGMNLNPIQEGNTIKVPIPKVTKEHRENLAKKAKAGCNKTKDQIRDIRNQAMKEAKKAKATVSEDTVRLVEKQIQQLTDDFNGNAEKILEEKSKELLK
ncbi:ribosome-recycling factor, mitochondrial-like [Branchiostoma floridae]|uniref:Ribosome-recycling factor, mitochondrial n=1 Tax=Branchiostoma floridae TaxID=7739 RepID=A0A9J7MWN0_BRAFL|nr:ribosome-recycling factor, mitochondrial-like [Branchiostoma floridae]